MSTASPAHDSLCDAAWQHHFTEAAPCGICAAIDYARSEERALYQETWKLNLPLISARNYRQGHQDALAGDPMPAWALVEPPPRKPDPDGALVNVTPEPTP
jgi:hypothetical protein